MKVSTDMRLNHYIFFFFSKSVKGYYIQYARSNLPATDFLYIGEKSDVPAMLKHCILKSYDTLGFR